MTKMGKSSIKKIINCFYNEQLRLQKDLQIKRFKLEKMIIELSCVFFSEPSERWYLENKAEKLQRKINELEEEIVQYNQAQIDLKKGAYELPIQLLDEPIAKFFRTIETFLVSNPNAYPTVGAYGMAVPHPKFDQMMEIKRELIFIQQATTQNNFSQKRSQTVLSS